MARSARVASLNLLQVSQFGGMNRRLSKFLLPEPQCQDILNFVFDERGALTKIAGFAKWNTTSVGSGPFQGGGRWYAVGQPPHFIEVHNGDVYQGDDATKTFTLIASGVFTAGTKIRSVVNRDLLFLVNGVDENKKWNGTTLTKMGVAAPTTAPSAATNGGGVLTGTYQWKVTFVTATAESNGSPASNQLTLSSNQVLLSSIPTSPDPQVLRRRIYRTAAGGSTYLFVGQINDNTTTTFVDNTPDASLGATIPTRNHPPERGSLIEHFKHRLWIAGDPNNPRRLYFSEFFEPESWPPTYYVDIPMVPGDRITAIKAMGDMLVIYGHNAPFLLIGETSFDFTVKRSLAQVGTDSAESVVTVENAHIYAGRMGVYAFDGAISRLLSDDIDPIIRDISATDWTKAAGVYYEKKKQYRLAVRLPGMPGTANTHELILDLRYQQWTKTDRGVQYYRTLTGPGESGTLFSASPTDGIFFEQDFGTTADGSTYTALWKSKAYPLGMLDAIKWFRHVLLWAEPSTGLVLEVTLDDDPTKVFVFDLSASGSSGNSLYGLSQYGSAVYGGQKIVRTERSYPQTAVGRYIQFRLEHTGAPTKVFSLETSYRLHPVLRVRWASGAPS